MRSGTGRDFLRGADGDHLAAGVAAPWAEVDHVIGGLDYVQMVLDQKYAMAGVNQAVERLEQVLDIGQVKARGRLVENVDCMSGALELAQLGRDLDPLRLASGERGGRLSQRQVSQTEVVQHLDLFTDGRLAGEKDHARNSLENCFSVL